MKLYKIALLSIFLFTSLTLSAAGVKTNGFIFGIAASFNDSTVYFTEVQPISDVWIDAKQKYLLSRDEYAYQLRDYMTKQGEPHRTCIVIFADSRKAIEKKYLAIKKKYVRQSKEQTKKKKKKASTKKVNTFDVRYIEPSMFSFKAVTPYEMTIAPTQTEKK